VSSGGRKSEKGWTGCPSTDNEIESETKDFESGRDSSSSTDTVTSLNTSPNLKIKDSKMDSNQDIEDKPDGTIGNVDPKALENALTVAASKAETVVTDQEIVEIEDTDDGGSKTS
jgi:hypothetical protein